MGDSRINEDGVFETLVTPEELERLNAWMDEHGDDPNVQELCHLGAKIETNFMEMRRFSLRSRVVRAAEAWENARQHFVDLDIAKGEVGPALELAKAECDLRDTIKKLQDHRKNCDLDARHADNVTARLTATPMHDSEVFDRTRSSARDAAYAILKAVESNEWAAILFMI